MNMADYEKKVYTALSGKVIGVYMGRPIEGWTKERIQERFGFLTGYLHEEQNVPLVVADDDISGTLTFVRALEDSGLYEKTPDDFFGKTWLNYLLEGQTILWWGGFSLSTEHTAYLRLKQGIPSPRSGSAALNGKSVSEQIGAQIFIDCFGMVAPGKPKVAAALAKKAASVSHDGEAVYAAMVVAAMVSIAFEETCMERILDRAILEIPSDSLIAQVHREVREWVKLDSDWEKTWSRIQQKYGYQTYGGNCHVIPNHAIMVMAWAYAGDDFYKAMQIVNSAGWDTDCNAANVGSVSALAAGLERLNERYDFRSPYADRIQLPSADGTDCTADVLQQAWKIARIGRRLMGWPQIESPKNGVWQHFEMPGAFHGYQSDDSEFRTRENLTVQNVEAPASFRGKRALSLQCSLSAGKIARAACPTGLCQSGWTAYQLTGTPTLYNGMTVSVRYLCRTCTKPVTMRLFVSRLVNSPDAVPAKKLTKVYSEPISLSEHSTPQVAEWRLQDCEGAAIFEFGFEFCGERPASAEILLDCVDYGGPACLAFGEILHAVSPREFPGWIADMDFIRGRFSDDRTELVHVGKNQGLGILVTGNRYWSNAVCSCEMKIHAADEAGFLLDYQGTQRFHAIVFTKNSIRIIRFLYGESLLAETKYVVPEDTMVSWKAERAGNTISISRDGQPVLSVNLENDVLQKGACGLFCRNGLIGFRNLAIRAQSRPIPSLQ